MKCFFCGYSGHGEQICLLLGRFRALIRKLDDGGIYDGKNLVLVVSANEEIKQAASILSLDAIAEVKHGSISMVDLNRALIRLTNNKDHNWRVRLLPKDSFKDSQKSQIPAAEFLQDAKRRLLTINHCISPST